jgi:hypothetical protein
MNKVYCIKDRRCPRSWPEPASQPAAHMLCRAVCACCVRILTALRPHLRAARLRLDDFTGCEAGETMDLQAQTALIAAAV